MSADCLFVLRNVAKVDELRQQLCDLSMEHGCGLYYDPMDALLYCGQIDLTDVDLMFEPTDHAKTICSDVLLSCEGYSFNGEIATRPLYDRLGIIQKFAEICSEYVHRLEIFISADNPCLNDYVVCDLECSEVADILFAEYKKCMYPYPSIPDVCLRIQGCRSVDSSMP